MRGSSRVLVLLGVLAGLALASVPAQAETTHPFLSSFDGSGTPSGSFRVAGRVGVDQGTGDVYVVDISSVFAGTGAIEVFDSSGVFKREISGEDTPAGAFAFSRIGSSGVAVDAASGDVYVADTRNNVVDVFDSTGAYERQLTGLVQPTGVAVDAEGHVWVAESGSGEDVNGMVHEFDATGALVQSWPNGYFQTDAIALDSSGRVYLLNGAGDVTRWTATGADETLIADSATGIAIDPGDDHLYVDKRNSVSEYDETGTFVVDFGSGRVANSFGVAVHGDSGRVYVSNSIPPVQVNVFGPLATIPDVSVGPADAITTTSATVSGTINPLGTASTYQFEWGTDTGYGNVAPATPGDAGSGTDEVPVTANLTNLAPGTTYHYRLRGTNTGGSNFSADGTFTTLSPPVIVSATGKGALASATLDCADQPPGSRHQLPLRVRPRRRLRTEHARRAARRRLRRPHRHGDDHGARARPDLPLPRRGDERERDHDRRRRHVQDDAPADDRRRIGLRPRRGERDPARLGQRERGRDGLPLRVRPGRLLRLVQPCRAGEHRLVERRAAGQHEADRARARDDLPLPRDRVERRRGVRGRRPHLHDQLGHERARGRRRLRRVRSASGRDSEDAARPEGADPQAARRLGTDRPGDPARHGRRSRDRERASEGEAPGSLRAVDGRARVEDNARCGRADAHAAALAGGEKGARSRASCDDDRGRWCERERRSHHAGDAPPP